MTLFYLWGDIILTISDFVFFSEQNFGSFHEIFSKWVFMNLKMSPLVVTNNASLQHSLIKFYYLKTPKNPNFHCFFLPNLCFFYPKLGVKKSMEIWIFRGFKKVKFNPNHIAKKHYWSLLVVTFWNFMKTLNFFW